MPGAVAAGDLAQDEPFYYYRAQRGGPAYRLPLELDPTEIAVKALSRDGVLAALAEAGLEVEADRYMLGTGHRRYRLQGATAEAVEQAVDQLRADPRVDFVGNAYRTSGGRGLILTDRVVARFEPGVGTSQVQELAESLGFTVQREPPLGRRSPTWWLGYPRGRDPLRFAAELHEHPLTEWASPDFVAEGRALTGVSDPKFDEQYYLRNDVTQNGVYVDVAADFAWEETTGSSGVKVAVIGTGIGGSHNQISHAKATSPAACQDGYDALADTVLSGGPWEPWGHIKDWPDSSAYEDSHETMVAGIIVAQHDQAGIAGIAPDVELLSVRIFIHDGVISPPASEIAEAIKWTWDDQGGCGAADVVIGSFHLEPHTAITTAIDDGADEEVVFVFSGGNFTSRGDSTVPVSYPGNLSKTISVGAIDRWGEIAKYSPDGDGSIPCTPTPGCWGGSNLDPDLVALSGHTRGDCETTPDSLAADVVTTDLSGDRGCDNTGYMDTFSGTSASAPQVAAAAALLLSDDGTLTRAQVTDLLKDSADAWGGEAEFGAGKLNIGASLGNRAPPLLSSVTIMGEDEVLPDDECTWWASVEDGESPYSYTWLKNTIPVGSTQSVLVETGTDDFDLIVHVEDARGGVTVSDTLSVTVTGLAGECLASPPPIP